MKEVWGNSSRKFQPPILNHLQINKNDKLSCNTLEASGMLDAFRIRRQQENPTFNKNLKRNKARIKGE